MQAYLKYLKQETKFLGIATFQPLWHLLGFTTPLTFEHCLRFLTELAAVFRNNIQDGISVDETILLVLGRFDSSQDILDNEIRACARQAVFCGVAWLTMIFQPSLNACDSCDFSIDMPLGREGLRSNQSIENTRRPIVSLVREFGGFLPSIEGISSGVDLSLFNLLYASNLNFASLRLVGKIRIKWTKTLGCHLMFEPLSRTLLLFSFPTLCALSCLERWLRMDPAEDQIKLLDGVHNNGKFLESNSSHTNPLCLQHCQTAILFAQSKFRKLLLGS